MALRSLLRRIPGPRMGPGHGLSTPAASRFVGTRSEGRPMIRAEDLDKMAGLSESFLLRRQQSIDEANKIHKEFEENYKTARLRLDELHKALDNLKKLADAGVAVFVAIPVLLILGSKYAA